MEWNYKKVTGSTGKITAVDSSPVCFICSLQSGDTKEVSFNGNGKDPWGSTQTERRHPAPLQKTMFFLKHLDSMQHTKKKFCCAFLAGSVSRTKAWITGQTSQHLKSRTREHMSIPGSWSGFGNATQCHSQKQVDWLIRLYLNHIHLNPFSFHLEQQQNVFIICIYGANSAALFSNDNVKCDYCHWLIELF